MYQLGGRDKALFQIRGKDGIWGMFFKKRVVMAPAAATPKKQRRKDEKEEEEEEEGQVFRVKVLSGEVAMKIKVRVTMD